MIAHLAEHTAAGHVVPADVVPALLAERDANDRYIRTGDERYLDGVCGEPSPTGERTCMWPKGHRPRIYDPGVVRDGRGVEVAHSWAEPSLWPPSLRIGQIAEVPGP
jgi:hypothetical protein